MGEIGLLVPRKRSGPAYFPVVLGGAAAGGAGDRGGGDGGLVNGVSTRKVDRLVAAGSRG